MNLEPQGMKKSAFTQILQFVCKGAWAQPPRLQVHQYDCAYTLAWVLWQGIAQQGAPHWWGPWPLPPWAQHPLACGTLPPPGHWHARCWANVEPPTLGTPLQPPGSGIPITVGLHPAQGPGGGHGEGGQCKAQWAQPGSSQ